MRVFIKLIIFGILLCVILTACAMVNAAAANSIELSSRDRLLNHLRYLQDTWHVHRNAIDDLHEQANDVRRQLCIDEKMLEFCEKSDIEIVVNVTSYNLVHEQTDHDPCHGAMGTNICDTAQNHGVVALTRDLLTPYGGGPFSFGDWIIVEHENTACTGIFRVEDTTADWLFKRVDIVRLNREDNHGLCRGATLRGAIL